MTAESVVYYLNRPPESDPNDQAEWLVTALGRYSGAELRELLYVAEEPGFFELVRGLFALSDDTRSVLQKFLAANDPRATTAAIDSAGRCILRGAKSEQPARMFPKIVY